jgi:hypothetical protein
VCHDLMAPPSPAAIYRLRALSSSPEQTRSSARLPPCWPRAAMAWVTCRRSCSRCTYVEIVCCCDLHVHHFCVSLWCRCSLHAHPPTLPMGASTDHVLACSPSFPSHGCFYRSCLCWWSSPSRSASPPSTTLCMSVRRSSNKRSPLSLFCW